MEKETKWVKQWREHYLNLHLKTILLQIQVNSFKGTCNTSSCWYMIILYHHHIKQTHPMIPTSTY